MTRFTQFAAAVAVAVSLFGCGAGKPAGQGHGVYMLLDTSGTYAIELKKAQQVIAAILSKLNPGDSFGIARIDSGSFSEKDIIAKATFDKRPSQANAQKRAFRDQVETAFRRVPGSGYTDITGGLLQGAEYLNETGAGTKTIIVFSDMQEELDKVTQRDFPISLKNIRVVAVNVVKLNTYVTDVRYRADLIPVREEFFGKKGPASTLVQVCALAHPDWMIEVEAIAVV